MGIKKKITGLFFRLPVGLLLLFLVISLIRASFSMPLDFSRTGVLFPFLVGLAAGTAFFSLFWKFRPLYVFSHELTHWLTAKLFRRQTGRFRVGFSGGSVEIANPNLWITLSPYFIPLYTLAWSGTYFLFRQLLPLLTAEFAHLAVAGIGITYAYHLCMTVFALGREQADIKVYGAFFSLSLILFANCILLFLGILAVTGQWRYGFLTLWQLTEEQALTLWVWLVPNIIITN